MFVNLLGAEFSMKQSVITGLVLLLYVLGFSQGEWNNWYFGQHAGITFNYGSPIALNNCASTFDDQNCTATCSDSLGNLLFYSDWKKVYNRNHVPMPNGASLAAGGASHHQLFYVKKFDDDSSYYLFTMICSQHIIQMPRGLAIQLST